MKTPPDTPRQRAIDESKRGGDPAKGVIWALVFIGDQIGQVATEINQVRTSGPIRKE